MHSEVAHLVAAATLPAYRGKGGQSALLRARVRDAAAAGCRFACADTEVKEPGTHNSSLHNLRRAGFTQLYVRDDWTWRHDTSTSEAAALQAHPTRGKPIPTAPDTISV